jgi:electron transfer flavoprotein beta subunit
VKRVPDTEARLRIAGDGGSVETSGMKFVLNPYDEFAVEAALKHKEAAGSGDVTVVTVGGSEAAETLRTALAMGADNAVSSRPPAASRGWPWPAPWPTR